MIKVKTNIARLMKEQQTVFKRRETLRMFFSSADCQVSKLQFETLTAS